MRENAGSAKPTGLKLLPTELLLSQDNYPSWARSVQDLALSEGIWGFITGRRRKELNMMRHTKQLTVQKFDEILTKGQEKALGLLRRTVSEVYLQMIEECSRPEQAWTKLKHYFAAKTVRNDSDLTARFTSLCMMADREDAAESYILEFNRIEQLLNDAEMSLPERMKKAVFVHGLPDELETTRVLMNKSKAGMEELQKDLIEAFESYWRKRPKSSDKVESVLMAHIAQLEERLDRLQGQSEMALATTNTESSRKRDRCKICNGRYHDTKQCFGNPDGPQYRAGWLEEMKLKRRERGQRYAASRPQEIDRGLPPGMQSLLSTVNRK